MKIKFGMIGKASRIILAILMIFTMAGLVSVTPAKTALAESAPSDPQEAIIKQVLVETCDEFGWTWDAEISDERIMVIPCADFIDGCYASYSIWAYIPFSGNYDERGTIEALDMTLPVNITSFRTEEAAALGFSQYMEESGLKRKFHGYPAVSESYESGESLEWQASRFTFSATIKKPTPEEEEWDILYHYGTDLEGLAEEFYEKAAWYGLIVGEGGAIPAQDSDGDGVTDDIDQCSGTPAGVAVDTSGCPIAERMILTVSTDKKIYSPGETVIVQGSVKDAEGNAIPGVGLAIEIEGTGIPTIAGTMYDLTNYSGPLDLPKDLPEGTYTVKVTASKTGYPPVSQTTSFTVGEVKIEVEGNYTGVAADGISELRFIAEFPKEATNPQFYCESNEGGTSFEKITLQSPCERVIDPEGKAQEGRMEIKFRPSEEMKNPHEVRVTVTVDMPDGQLSAYKDIQVVRPPVVLIHGIWSNRVSMMPLRRSLIDSEQYPAGHTLVVDYGTSPTKSNQDLRKSAESLAAGVDRTLKKLEEEGIKVSRVDIVAHSMGGLIARYYMFFGYLDSKGQVIGPGQAAKVRKLITLDTPHAGSHVADWYVDFINQRYLACGDNWGSFDRTKVTDNELKWFLNIIRSHTGMPSDGLEFGEAVKQLQTPGRPGSIIDELLRGQSDAYPSGAHVRYYLIAGDTSLLKVWEKWFIVGEVMDKYPYRSMFYDQEGMLYVSRDYGPCMEYIGKTSFTNPYRTVVNDMVREFRDKVGQEGTDGIVTVNSQLDSTRAANGRMTFHSNHLSITDNRDAYDMVMRYLTDDQVMSSG